jgi:hypothetical protein
MGRMPTFSIHRMKDNPRQQFRWAPHTSGVTLIKPRDFEPAGEIEAAGFYDAWMSLRGTERALDIGDVLELGGEIRICKYVGFEEARWVLPEVKLGLENMPLAAGSQVLEAVPGHA